MVTSTPEIYTLSLHDALPILIVYRIAQELKDGDVVNLGIGLPTLVCAFIPPGIDITLQSENGFIRSEEHTSELQSRPHLVCRLLLEKKKNKQLYSHLPNVQLT